MNYYYYAIGLWGTFGKFALYCEGDGYIYGNGENHDHDDGGPADYI